MTSYHQQVLIILLLPYVPLTINKANRLSTRLLILFFFSAYKPWEAGNDYIGRLLMNYLQHECRLQPTIIRPSRRAEYLRILGTAKREEIGEVFVSYMMEHCHDRAEKEDVVEPVGSGMAVRQKPAAAPAAHHTSEAPRTRTANRTGGSAAGKSAPAPAKLSSRDAILKHLRKNPYMSTRDLAEEIGISAKGVEKQLGILKATGRLRRIGPDKGGKWEVVV